MAVKGRKGGEPGRMPASLDVRGLARQVTGSRSGFAAVYDEQARSSARAAAAAGARYRPFMVVAVGCHDDADAYAKAFAEAHRQKWSGRLILACVAAGLLSERTAARPGRQVDPQRSGEPGSGVVTQAMTNTEAGFIDAAIVSRGGIEATQRVCKIYRSDTGKALGTGFLVGPQAVLTAWHVVADFLVPVEIDGKRSGRPKPGSQEALRFLFDDLLRPEGRTAQSGLVSDFGLAEAWLAAGSPNHPLEKRQNGRPGKWPDRLEELDGHFDFAVVMLDGTPGLERGWYKLDGKTEFVAGEADDWQGDHILVFQHPVGEQQRLGVSTSTRWFGAGRWRLGHQVNTLGGSSGGLCLDKNFKLVGLHQADIGDGWNCAVPVHHVAPRVGDIEAVGEAYTTVARVDGKPVFGRQKLQRLIWSLAVEEKRFLVVNRPKDRGNSFCYEIMRCLLPSERHVIVKLDFGEIGEAKALADRLLAEVEKQPLGVLPSKLTTDTAWIGTELVPAFMTRLNGAVQSRLLWVVLDGLRGARNTAASGSKFLQLLYRNIAGMPALRFVFLESTTPPDGADPQLTESDIVADRSESEATAYLMRMHKERLAHAGIQQAELLARIADGIAAAEGGGLETLQAIVHRSFDPYLSNG